MTPKNRAAFYEAIISYAVAGTPPQLPKSIRGYWPVVKPMLDAAKKHYEAGEKGGRPSKTCSFGFDSSETNGFENPETNKKNKNNKKTEEGEKEPPPTAAPALQADAELADIIQHYQAEIGDFPRSALEKLQVWREVFTVELICKAFDEAAENGVRNWKYIDGILKGWQKDGVKTLGDVERRREARKKPDKPKEKEWEVLR